MKIIVIGSSNAHRFEKFLKDDEKKNIEVRKCTRFESFRVGMDELEESDKKVLITVIENFVCDSVNASEGEDRVSLKKVLNTFLFLHIFIIAWFKIVIDEYAHMVCGFSVFFIVIVTGPCGCQQRAGRIL